MLWKERWKNFFNSRRNCVRRLTYLVNLGLVYCGKHPSLAGIVVIASLVGIGLSISDAILPTRHGASLSCATNDLYGGYVLGIDTQFAGTVFITNNSKMPFLFDVRDPLNRGEIWIEVVLRDDPEVERFSWKFAKPAIIESLNGEDLKTSIRIRSGETLEMQLTQLVEDSDFQVEAFNQYRLRFVGSFVSGEISCLVHTLRIDS